MKRAFSWSLIVLCGVGMLAIAMTGQDRLWGQRLDPVAVGDAESSVEFALQLDGQTVAYFEKCVGLTSSSSVATSTTTTPAGFETTMKRPGDELFRDDITLTRRVVDSDYQLWQWRQAVERGDNNAVKDGLIILTVSGIETGSWQFVSGWPVRLSVDDAIEELTIAHNGLERIDGRTTRTRTR